MKRHMKRRIAYGIGNWPELVRNGKYYYVDHTAFIRELEKYRTPVFLRPRRFGKTIWCSLLECYIEAIRCIRRAQDLRRRVQVQEGKSEEGRARSEERARVTAADRRQVAAYAKDVKALHPTKAVEAYVCSIVGRRSYAFAKVKAENF